MLDGGEGSDVYLISNSAEHSVAEFDDTGAHGIDQVRFAATASSTLQFFAADEGIERIVLGTGVGLQADSSSVLALSVDGHMLTSGIEVIGNNGANRIEGGSGDDKLQGGAGDDFFARGRCATSNPAGILTSPATLTATALPTS